MKVQTKIWLAVALVSVGIGLISSGLTMRLEQDVVFFTNLKATNTTFNGFQMTDDLPDSIACVGITGTFSVLIGSFVLYLVMSDISPVSTKVKYENRGRRK